MVLNMTQRLYCKSWVTRLGYFLKVLVTNLGKFLAQILGKFLALVTNGTFYIYLQTFVSAYMTTFEKNQLFLSRI